MDNNNTRKQSAEPSLALPEASLAPPEAPLPPAPTSAPEHLPVGPAPSVTSPSRAEDALLTDFRDEVDIKLEVRKFSKYIFMTKIIFGEFSQEFFSEQRALFDVKDAQWEGRYQRQARHNTDLQNQVEAAQKEARIQFNRIHKAAQQHTDDTTEKLRVLSDAQTDFKATQKDLLDDIAILKGFKTTLEENQFLPKQFFDRLWQTQDLENERNDLAFDLLLQLVRGLRRYQDFQVRENEIILSIIN